MLHRGGGSAVASYLQEYINASRLISENERFLTIAATNDLF